MSVQHFPRAGFWVRLAAIIYDVLVVVAVLMLAAALALGLSVALAELSIWPLAQGQDHAQRLQGNWLYRIYLLCVFIGFYALFWTRGGQTLGMKAWRLRVQSQTEEKVSFKQACLRAITSLFGLGNLLVLFSAERLALQDKIAGCEVVRLTPEANQFKNWKGAPAKKNR